MIQLNNLRLSGALGLIMYILNSRDLSHVTPDPIGALQGPFSLGSPVLYLSSLVASPAFDPSISFCISSVSLYHQGLVLRFDEAVSPDVCSLVYTIEYTLLTCQLL